MVAWDEELRDVVLFGAGQSLLLQMASWAAEHKRFPLRVVTSRRREHIRQAARGGAFVLIDATADGPAAVAILDEARRAIPAQHIAVYTERMHPGLELAVRERETILLLGSMSTQEWKRALERIETEAAVGG